jgi:hypothetical protein
MDRDQFFNQLFDESGDQYEAIRAQRQLAYEERIIKRVFKECGIKPQMGRLVNACRNMTGTHTLSFQWFNADCQFPARLCGQRIYKKLHKLTVLDIFRPAVRNRLFKAVFMQLHKQDINTADRFVFVFPVVRTMLCAHNVHAVSGTGPQLTMTNEATTLTIEPTTSFFQALGAEWYSPD